MSGGPIVGSAKKNIWTRIPLSLRILGAVVLGITFGLLLGPGHKELFTALSDSCKIFIDLLKALATPLIFFAVIDAMVRTNISGRKGAKLVTISLVNACVAIVIGLSVANIMRGGDAWKGHLDEIGKEVAEAAQDDVKKARATLEKDKNSGSLSFVDQLKGYIPADLVTPFSKNNIITVVIMAIFVGAALRRLRSRALPETENGVKVLEDGVQSALHLFAVILGWVVEIIPVAIFGVVALVAGKFGQNGWVLLKDLGIFLAVIMLGFFIHAVLYYCFLLIVIGRTSPLKFFKGGSEAILTALSCGSSLATLPTTLRCLKDKLKISDANARLAACVGTNLNHDGIILYEAAATIFIAQAIGMNLDFSQQMVVALASIMAGIGIAGVPEAGLITLNLVLNAGGIPPDKILLVLPLLFTVDWIIGRGRATVNVISDMTVATLLERIDPDAEKPVEG